MQEKSPSWPSKKFDNVEVAQVELVKVEHSKLAYNVNNNFGLAVVDQTRLAKRRPHLSRPTLCDPHLSTHTLLFRRSSSSSFSEAPRRLAHTIFLLRRTCHPFRSAHTSLFYPYNGKDKKPQPVFFVVPQLTFVEVENITRIIEFSDASATFLDVKNNLINDFFTGRSRRQHSQKSRTSSF